ncbi:MAG: J domain-containing protein [Pseudomonadota bacterium]|nr:J domain-containing protein [Pseudomonadota bacterium]
MKPDLESLYSQLDLQPDCSLEEFQRAYRRRIGELHPDRNQDAQQSTDLRTQLRHLIWMHATVNRFYRRYGRMPGAAAGPRHRNCPVASTPLRTHSPERFSEFEEGETSNRSTWILVVVLIALMVLGAFWNWLAAGPLG